MNKVIMIGNLTKDPELQTTQTGVSVCRFSIAVNRNFVNPQTNEREADFFNVVAWRGLAENCGKYLAKGRKVGVVGSVQNRSFEDKEGNKRYVTEIAADDVEFLSPRTEGSQQEHAPRESKPSGELKPIESDDLPF